MNCNQFNSIKLEEVLVSLGHHPTKQNEKEAWYLNPFSTETQASFKLNKRNNVWYLHSEGIGGNNIDFMMKYLKASVKEVLEWAEKQNFSSFQSQKDYHSKSSSLNYHITEIEVKDIQHPALLEYLKSRKVENQTTYLKEIHYQINDKSYFGIGFKNDSGGFEIRNKYSKICLGKKDISTIKNGEESLRIFEGFFDFLSFKNLEDKKKKKPSDYIILNSVSMIPKIKNLIQNYQKVELYFDNDNAGNRAVEMIKNAGENIEDCRILYKTHKDLNEFLMSWEMRKKDTGREYEDLNKINTRKIGR